MAFCMCVFPWADQVRAQGYDPLRIDTSDLSKPLDLTIKDEDRQREIPIRVYLPTSDKYQLVLHDAEHHAFSDGEGRRRQRDPNHHRVILALSTAFWDAYLRDDESAITWLHGDSPRKIMAKKDKWQHTGLHRWGSLSK